MREKVYIDSTIPSYYFDRRESLATFAGITRQWWSEMADAYELFISDAVIRELNRGDYPNKGEVLALVSGIPSLPLPDDLEQIVEFYVANYVMPQTLAGDAAHLAYASYYNVDYLLTWNCNHLANANKRKHIRIINGRLGLATPEIVIPLQLFQEGEKPMIHSEILAEKYRVQAKLAAESTSIRDYLERSRLEAQEVAKKYGFEIKYADLPGTKLAMSREAIDKAIEEAGR